MVRQQKEKQVLWWNVGKHCGVLKGKELVKTLWDSPCMMALWKPLNTCGWIFGLVHSRLYCWISKKYTSLEYYCSTIASAQQNETLLLLAEMNYVKIQIKIWWHNMVRQGIMYLKQNRKWILARLFTVDFLAMLTISLSLFFDRIAKQTWYYLRNWHILSIQYLENVV